MFTVTTPGFWAFRGTGVQVGSTFTGIVANEVDVVSHQAGTPRPLQVVAYSPTTCGTKSTHSTMTYYTTPSGAGVVSTGSMGWILDAMALPSRVPPASYDFVRTVTSTLLQQASIGPLGLRYPAQDNLNQYKAATAVPGTPD